jgi:hypothetical protein
MIHASELGRKIAYFSDKFVFRQNDFPNQPYCDASDAFIQKSLSVSFVIFSRLASRFRDDLVMRTRVFSSSRRESRSRSRPRSSRKRLMNQI